MLANVIIMDRIKSCIRVIEKFETKRWLLSSNVGTEIVLGWMAARNFRLLSSEAAANT